MRTLVLVVTCALLLGSLGCSSFHREWDDFPNYGEDTIAGRWEGTWESFANGHTGRLRCMLRPREASPGEFDARFWATYGLMFRFTYEMVLTTEPLENGVRIRGREDLGWLAGGEYRYQGSIEGERFLATYRSEADHGKYELRRVPAEIDADEEETPGRPAR